LRTRDIDDRDRGGAVNPPDVARLSKRLWLLFSLFVLYGTTIPFNFTTDHDIIALHLSRISVNPLIDSETGGRISGSDSLQNIVLFLPFGVLGVLAARSDRHRLRRVLAVTALGAALSVSVETLQLFTRDRITSTSDVMTNTLGALIGALAISTVRGVPARALGIAKRSRLIDRRTFYPFMVAFIVVCLAQWEPFDATFDLGSVFSKAKAFGADVWQYSGMNDEGVALLQFALFGAATVAWLEELAISSAASLAIAVGVPLAFGLEMSQIFIGSRMPGLEDAVVRGTGVVVGVLLCQAALRGTPRRGWIALVIIATAIGAAIQMLNPFELAPTRNAFQWLPFLNYYEVTTSNTLSHALELMLIYFPFGFFFVTMVEMPRRRAWAAVVLIVLAIAVPIEYLQGFVVGRFPDVTDPSLSALGGWVGAWAGTRGAAGFRNAVDGLTASDQPPTKRGPSGYQKRV
jgi:VanZ family protein